MFIKTFKKSIALFVALVFMLSLVPVIGMAGVEETTIKSQSLTKIEHVVTRGGYSTPNAVNAGVRINFGSNEDHTNTYNTFIKYDFSSCIKQFLSADSAAFYLGGNEKDGSSNSYTFRVLSGGYEDWAAADLDHYTAKENGMMSDPGTFTSTQAYSGSSSVKQEITSDGLLQGIKQALYNDPEDTVVIFRLFTPTGGQTRLSVPSIGFSFTYDENNLISDEEFVDLVVEELNWNSITSQSIDNVESNLNLYNSFLGASIVWESSNEDVINPLNGEVALDPYVSNEVKLTANISYTGESGVTHTEKKEFDVVVRDVADSFIPLTNTAYTRSNSDDMNNEYGPHHITYNNVDYSYIRFGDNMYDAYAQLDFTGYEEILRNPGTTIKTSFYSTYLGSNIHWANAYKVYMVADSNDSYNGEELSHVKATTVYDLQNTEGRPVLFEKVSSSAERGVFYSDVMSTDDVLNVLDEGSDNSLVSLFFKSTYEQLSTIVVEVGGKPSELSGMTITYDKSKIDNEAYIAEVKDALTWNVLSEGAQDKVSADLYLPTKFKGADIVWKSDNAAVLSDGTVDFANNKGETVKLTANMTYTNILGDVVTAEKEFELKISDGTFYAVGTPTLELDGDKFKASWNVENYTGTDVTYNVYLAVYSNQELVALTPVIYVAKNGKLTSTAPVADYAEGYTAKLIAVQGDEITPVFKALER